jgi:hypothetical protein
MKEKIGRHKTRSGTKISIGKTKNLFFVCKRKKDSLINRNKLVSIIDHKNNSGKMVDSSMNFQTGFDDNLGKGDKAVGSLIRKLNTLNLTSPDIRIQQRKANKYITTIQGIPPEFDFKKILRAFKKV